MVGVACFEQFDYPLLFFSVSLEVQYVIIQSQSKQTQRIPPQTRHKNWKQTHHKACFPCAFFAHHFWFVKKHGYVFLSPFSRRTIHSRLPLASETRNLRREIALLTHDVQNKSYTNRYASWALILVSNAIKWCHPRPVTRVTCADRVPPFLCKQNPRNCAIRTSVITVNLRGPSPPMWSVTSVL